MRTHVSNPPLLLTCASCSARATLSCIHVCLQTFSAPPVHRRRSLATVEDWCDAHCHCTLSYIKKVPWQLSAARVLVQCVSTREARVIHLLIAAVLSWATKEAFCSIGDFWVVLYGATDCLAALRRPLPECTATLGQLVRWKFEPRPPRPAP